MPTSQSISDFQAHCQRFYICYSFSIAGLLERSERIINLQPDISGTLILCVGHPSEGRWHGSINKGELIAASQKDGAFPDAIAKSFFTSIYSLWDEYYRHQIAKEVGVDQKAVKSDLMGDLRLIRHCIVHKKSIITDEPKKFKELTWKLSPGPFQISEGMFQGFIEQINKMVVQIEE